MKYNRWVLKGAVLPAILILATQVPASAPASRTKVKLLSIEVNNRSTSKAREVSDSTLFGTTLRLLVELPDKQISAIDTDASKILVFRDDKGKDLAKGKPLHTGMPPRVLVSKDFLFYSFDISSDRRRCSFGVNSFARPAKGATKMLLKGNFVFLCGSGLKTYVQRDLSLKVGERVAAGPFTLIAESVRATEKNSSLDISFSVVPPTHQIRDVIFYDKLGQKIPYGSAKSLNGPRKATSYISYQFDSKQNPASIKVFYYEKISTVSVPVDIQTGIGL